MRPLSLNEISSRSWGAVVIGAGCAGAIVARQLALQGRDVLLVDRARFPRYKVCGCCLGVPAQEMLAAIGLDDLLRTTGAVKTTEMVVASAGRRVRFPLPNYAVLSRERLDMALVNAASAAGATFLDAASATAATSPQEYQRVSLRRADENVSITAKITILAHGLGNGSSRTSHREGIARIGAGAVSSETAADYNPGSLYMACGRGGYVGVCRLEDGRTTVAAAMDVDFLKNSESLAHAAQHLLAQAGFAPIRDLLDIPWKGTPLLNQRPASVASHRTFLVGDAAGYVEPFTGEGMKWAITSAVKLAPIAASAMDNYSPALENAWIVAHRSVVSGRTRACKCFSAALRHEWLVNGAIKVVSVMPAIAAPFVRQLNAPISIQKGLHQ